MNPTILEILALVAKEYGFAVAEALINVVDSPLRNYNPDATYNDHPAYVKAMILEWKDQRKG